MPDIRKAFGSRAIHPGLLTGAERLLYEGFLRRQQTNSTVRRMAGDGLPIKQIVRMTGLSRNLVRQIRRGEREDAFRLRQSRLEPWLPWLTREWESGCRNGAELWRRLRAKGFGGSLRVVGEWATRQRRAEASAYAAPGRCPSARRIARMMTTARDHLSRSDAVTVARIEAAVPDLAAACALTGRFANMVSRGIRYGAGRLGSPLTLFDFEGPMYKAGRQMGPSLCRRPITFPEDPPIVAIHS